MLDNGCLAAGSNVEYVGETMSCEIQGGLGSGLHGGRSRLSGGASYSTKQVNAMRRALVRARLQGISDYSPQMKAIIRKAIKKAQ